MVWRPDSISIQSNDDLLTVNAVSLQTITDSLSLSYNESLTQVGFDALTTVTDLSLMNSNRRNGFISCIDNCERNSC